MASTSRLQAAAKIALAALILAGLIWTVEWQTIVDLARRASWTWAAAAILLVPLNVLLDAWVWGVLLRRLDVNPSLQELTAAVLSGFALGFLTPGRIGEYPGRALHIDGGDGWAVAVSIAVQRVADMAVAVCVGTLGLAITLQAGLLPATTPWIGGLVGSAGSGLVLSGIVAFPKSIDAVGRRLLPSASWLHDRTAFLSRVTRWGRLRVVGGTLARYVVFAGQLALLARAFAPEATFTALSGAASTTYLGAFLIPPVTIMDLGIREGAAVFFFGVWGLGDAVGFNASILIFAINIVLPSALGIPFVRSLHLSRGTGSERAGSAPDKAASSPAPGNAP